jgi:hypothetical protein
VAAVIFAVGIVIGILFLRETLASRRDRPDVGLIAGEKLIRATKKPLVRVKYWFLPHSAPETEPLLKDDERSPRSPTRRRRRSHPSDPEAADAPVKPKKQETQPGFREVLTKQAVLNLLVYMLIAFYSIGYDQALPVSKSLRLYPKGFG